MVVSLYSGLQGRSQEMSEKTFKHLDGRDSETRRHYINEQARATAVWLMRIDAPSLVLPLGDVFEPPVYIL